MFEVLVSGLVRIMVWLWSSAMTLYYLAGFFVVASGLIIFLGSVIHHLWKTSRDQRAYVISGQTNVNVRVENLNVDIELTPSQLRELMAQRDPRALPPSRDEAAD